MEKINRITIQFGQEGFTPGNTGNKRAGVNITGYV